MKVREALSSPANVPGKVGKDGRRISDSKETDFQGQLKRAETRSCEERLHALVEEISRQGEKLAEKMDIKELKLYKKLISDFLDEAVSSSHKFCRQEFLDRRGRHRIYAIIRKVNEKVELLTQDVLSAEKDNIKILQRLDDIRGLILDIIM